GKNKTFASKRLVLCIYKTCFNMMLKQAFASNQNQEAIN
ncbi:hypothetical protein M078_4426, partial [Bacteroides fragilis str. 2-F-2 